MINPLFSKIVVLAFVIKLTLVCITTSIAPEAKVMIDSQDYLSSGKMLITEGVFSKGYNDEGIRQYEWYRTPGYPLFLGLVHFFFNIPLSGVVIIQLFLTLITAYMVYQAACSIDPRLGLLSSLIILYDPPITIFSLLILTETLFLFFMGALMYTFLLYIKSEEFKMLIVSSLLLVMAVFTRPIAFWLGIVMILFLFYTSYRKKAKHILLHAVIFGLIVYSALSLWQMRNYNHFGIWTFSSISRATVDSKGLIGSYARTYPKKDVNYGVSPVLYYWGMTSRSVVSFMTRPGTLKYFNSIPLKYAGKIFSYPFVGFWLIGFLFGITKMNNNLSYHFLLTIVLYFIVVSVCGAMLGVSSRLRVPLMPFIAILSAHGWDYLKCLWVKKGRRYGRS